MISEHSSSRHLHKSPTVARSVAPQKTCRGALPEWTHELRHGDSKTLQFISLQCRSADASTFY